MSVDSSDIDAALIMKLGSDATLLALCPNGVYMDEAPPGSTRFVIVSLVVEEDEPVFSTGRAIEDALYLVEARMLSSAGGNIKGAAARIDVLLEDGTLAVSGYNHMTMFREGRVRLTEVDALSPDLRWQRRGGRYRVQQSLS